jgi:N-acetylglucosaminyl-diphospho-decaprenol L-rhamnosyltransferase
MELSIICVNWNSADYLRECIASVYEYTREISFEIIVVDNASSQEGVDTLREQFPEVTIIKSAKNLGFAGANNVGFRHSTGAYVLLLNPDTKLISAAINIMLAHMKSLPDAGIVGCRLLNTDLSVQLTAIQKFPTILNQVLDLEYLQLRWPHCPLWEIAPLFSTDVKLLKVEVISGACMLLRRQVFEQVGMFSEDYFMYAEDIDLNYKVKSAGFTNYYVGEAAMIHHGSKSSSRQEISFWATIMKYRAMRKLFQKTRGRLYGSMYRVAMGCAAAGRLTVLALAYPLGNILWDREALKFATRKWRVILRWALGRQSMVLQDR